jgi:hypothetical protein
MRPVCRSLDISYFISGRVLEEVSGRAFRPSSRGTLAHRTDLVFFLILNKHGGARYTAKALDQTRRLS